MNLLNSGGKYGHRKTTTKLVAFVSIEHMLVPYG